MVLFSDNFSRFVYTSGTNIQAVERNLNSNYEMVDMGNIYLNLLGVADKIRYADWVLWNGGQTGVEAIYKIK